MRAFEKGQIGTLVAKRVKLPRNFEGEVVVESVRALIGWTAPGSARATR